MATIHCGGISMRKFLPLGNGLVYGGKITLVFPQRNRSRDRWQQLNKLNDRRTSVRKILGQIRSLYY